MEQDEDHDGKCAPFGDFCEERGRRLRRPFGWFFFLSQYYVIYGTTWPDEPIMALTSNVIHSIHATRWHASSDVHNIPLWCISSSNLRTNTRCISIPSSGLPDWCNELCLAISLRIHPTSSCCCATAKFCDDANNRCTTNRSVIDDDCYYY